MPIAVTRSAGTAVHKISRPVWPWIGGPSASSSSGTRHFQTEKTTTAATSEKMMIETIVANQKIAWMRSNSSDADVGSHLKSTATNVIATAITIPIATSWTMPLRTAVETTPSRRSRATEEEECRVCR